MFDRLLSSKPRLGLPRVWPETASAGGDPRALALCAALVTFAWAPEGRAEQLIIRNAGDHPRYSVELEPHLIAGFVSPLAGSGAGLGARASIPIVENGFVSSINNSVAIGFGIDWMRYGGCYHGWNYVGSYCDDLSRVWLPVTLQWNFYLSTHFSVFGEPGIALHWTDWAGAQGCYYYEPNGRIRYGGCGQPHSGGRFDLDPFVLMVGGRYHVSRTVSLTARIGYPYFSFGVSFFP